MSPCQKTNCIIHHTGLSCLIMVCCAGLSHLQIAQFGLIAHDEAILGGTYFPEEFSTQNTWFAISCIFVQQQKLRQLCESSGQTEPCGLPCLVLWHCPSQEYFQWVFIVARRALSVIIWFQHVWEWSHEWVRKVIHFTAWPDHVQSVHWPNQILCLACETSMKSWEFGKRIKLLWVCSCAVFLSNNESTKLQLICLNFFASCTHVLASVIAATLEMTQSVNSLLMLTDW